MGRSRKRRTSVKQRANQDATDQQQQFIRVLLKELAGAALQEDKLNQLTKGQARSIIEELQSVQAELRRLEEHGRRRRRGRDESAARARRAWLMAMTLWRW